MENLKEYLTKQADGTYELTLGNGDIEVPDSSCDFYYYFPKNNEYVFSRGQLEFNGIKLLWTRHTHPEELPFIDDEPSINDQYAEIEKVRQSHRTASETSNPTIKETLNQRQSQYGSFEDVAMITEQMVDVMRKGYYENLAYNQKMALYMICSKMARIVNGDPNHKDSWHDIAGYATLIDNELESEKDMPF